VALKIETIRSADWTIVNLFGDLEGEYLSELRTQIEAAEQKIALGMEEVALVDLDAIRFLIDCEKRGIQLRGCSAYIREWIAREKEREK
jgi:hypothetical protein